MLFLLLSLNVVLTVIGGLVALRFSERSGAYVSAFSSGILISVAVVSLLPESFQLEHAMSGAPGHRGLLEASGLGFLVFYLLDLAVPEQHEAGHEHHRHAPATPRIVGLLGAAMLCAHRGIDGVILETAETAGVLESVGMALVFHNFADGLTTVSVLLRDGQSRRRALLMVTVVALFPFVGMLLGRIWHLPTELTAVALAFIAGAFLYIGGSHLLVREHNGHARYAPLVAVIGFALVFLSQS
jgi:zinc transporter, ZIP family